MTTKAPETIWAETTPYDFPGYSPAWVWHHPESLEDGSEGLERYVHADLHAAIVAERDALREALKVLINHAHECEKQLTEDLYHVDFCGESKPLTDARRAIAKQETKE